MGQLAAVCNHLVAYDVQKGDYKPVAGASGIGEWALDGSSTVSDSTEPNNGGRRADAGAQAGAYPNSPLAPRAAALHADFGGYANQSLAVALHSEFGAPAALRYLSSQHPNAEAYRMVAMEHAAPFGQGVLESQSHTAAFGALAAAAPLGGVRTAQPQTASFAQLAAQPQPSSFAQIGGVYGAQYATHSPRAEHAIAGAQHMASPSGIAQASNPAGIGQGHAPSGIVSSDSGTAPTSGAPPLSTGADSLRLIMNQLIAAPDAGSRACALGTQSGGDGGSLHLGLPEGKIPAEYARDDTGGGAAQLLPLGGLSTSYHPNDRNRSLLPCSLPPSPPSERVDGSTGEPGAGGGLTSPTPSTGSTGPRRANGALLRGAAATALAHRQRQQRPAADSSASIKRRLAGPTGDDAARLPIWRRSVPLVARGNLRSSIAIVIAAILVNGPPPPPCCISYLSLYLCIFIILSTSISLYCLSTYLSIYEYPSISIYLS